MKKILLTISLIVMSLIMSGCSSSSLVLEGIVETTIYSHYSEVSGKIIQLPIELGQEVKAGDLIGVIDDSNEQYALEQLQETLVKKEAALAELTQGADPEEIKQSRNNVTIAEIAYNNALLTKDRASEDYKNALTLREAGAMAQTDLDKVKYQADLAEAAVTTTSLQLDNTRQKLALLQKGASQEKIDSAQAEIALTQIQISQIKSNLEKYRITALTDGTIASKNYLLGNIVSPGHNLADIAAGTEKHLVAYVPKDYLSKVSYGQELSIRNAQGEYEGTISYIDIEAQYTPKDMQTSANKNKESMKIKVKLNPDTPLKVGEKAELVINVQ